MLKPMFEILTVTSMHRKCSETSSGVEPLQYKSQLSRKNSTSLYRLPARLSTSSWEEPQPNCDLNLHLINKYKNIYIYNFKNFITCFTPKLIFLQNYQNMLDMFSVNRDCFVIKQKCQNLLTLDSLVQYAKFTSAIIAFK